MKPVRYIIDTLDSSGHIIKVPVGRKPNLQFATLDKASWQQLQNLEVNPVWYINKRIGKVIAYCGIGRQWRCIDRIIADCQPYQSCFPKDNDPLNLKRDNLVTGHSSKARRAARNPDYIPQPKRDDHIIQIICTYGN